MQYSRSVCPFQMGIDLAENHDLFYGNQRKEKIYIVMTVMYTKLYWVREHLRILLIKN
jgi:hypothetical protein